MCASVVAEEGPRLVGLSLALLVVAGALVIALGYISQNDPGLVSVLYAIGASLEAAVAVALADRLLPARPLKSKLMQGNAAIYAEFEKMVNALDPKKPHVIRTTNSFPPEKGAGDRWDEIVKRFLTQNSDSQFIRIVLFQNTPEWTERRRVMADRYRGLENYHQHSREAPRAMEMFLVDRREVLLSVGTPEKGSPSITYGTRIRDSRLCEQLEAYHRIQLEQQIPRDAL